MQADSLRADFLRLVQDKPGGAVPRRPGAVHLGASGLTIGTRPFSAAAVRDWWQAAWEAAILRASLKGDGLGGGYPAAAMYTGYLLPDNEYCAPSPLPAVLYAFSQLAPDAWIAPDGFDTLLDVLYAGPGHPASATMCQTGWENSLLVRYRADGKDYYRVAGAAVAPADDGPEGPEGYLPAVDGTVFVDLGGGNYPGAPMSRPGPATVLAGRARGRDTGGSGVIVLPCGSGKTLIVTTNNISVSQWRDELLDKTLLAADAIGEFTGIEKTLKPVTITMYQMLTHRSSRDAPLENLRIFMRTS